MNQSRKNKSTADVAGPSGIAKVSRGRWSEGVYVRREREEEEWFFLSRACRGPPYIASRPLRRGWSISCKSPVFYVAQSLSHVLGLFSRPIRIRQTIACEGDSAERIMTTRPKARLLIFVFQKGPHLHLQRPVALLMRERDVAELQLTSHSDRHSEVIADHATRARFENDVIGNQNYRSRDYYNGDTGDFGDLSKLLVKFYAEMIGTLEQSNQK